MCVTPCHASQSSEDVGAAVYRLAELSDMLSKGEPPVVPDTQDHREWIAVHLFSINGDVGLPGRFCTGQAEEGCLALGCVECQSRLSRPCDHYIYF